MDTPLACFSDYLSDRNQIVCVDGICSDPQPVQSGVPQGSIFGPLLFILYISDLPSCLQFSEILLYADDIVIYFSGNSICGIDMKLSLDLTNVSCWLKEYQENEMLNLALAQDNDLRYLEMQKTEVGASKEMLPVETMRSNKTPMMTAGKHGHQPA